jgi:predicted nuclease of restriction endonuclease-like (RecB) superfamily
VTLKPPQADLARETLKNPYNFDFLLLGKDVQERDLEHALTDHIQKFIMELGKGFAYMGRQFAINVGGDDFYLDLLFYHTRLRCRVGGEGKPSMKFGTYRKTKNISYECKRSKAGWRGSREFGRTCSFIRQYACYAAGGEGFGCGRS